MSVWDRFWLDLRPADLKEWSSEVERGSALSESVSALGRTSEGEVVAWVGSRARQATVIWWDDDGPASECTCGASFCSHAVAVVFALQKRRRSGGAVPLVGDGDPRLLALDEAFKEEEGEESPQEVTLEDLEKYLLQLREGDLRGTIIELVREEAAVRQVFAERLRRHREELDGLVQSARMLIREAGGEAGLRHVEVGRGGTACARTHKVLLGLSEKGLHDEVMRLGEALVARVEGKDLSESQRGDLERCLEVVAEASYEEVRSLVDRTVWAMSILEKPIASTSRALMGVVEDAELQIHEWVEVAELLKDRLDDRSGEAARRNRVQWLVRALERGERGEEVVALLEDEASRNGRFTPLVDHLLGLGRHVEAERWAREGALELARLERWSEMAALRALLVRSLEARQDWPSLASLSVEDYLSRGWNMTYEVVRRRCQKVGVWPRVRSWILHFLKTGQAPSASYTVLFEGRRVAWPLPDVEISEGGAFPKTLWLIEIALKEHRVDDALALYEEGSASAPSMKEAPIGVRIADAISRREPKRAISLWLARAESLLGGDERERATALRLLGKVMKAYARLGEKESWLELERALSSRHKHDRRLIRAIGKLQGW